MPTTKTYRVLQLDQGWDIAGRLAHNHDVPAEVTSLILDEIYTVHGYTVSDRGCELAGKATLEQYDAIVIGNNRGTGVEYAMLIPDEMKSRTIIVWNSSSTRNVAVYERMGFTHFCSRVEQVDRLAELLQQFG